MGWQDVIGSVLTAGATGDPMAWQRNKLEQAFKQFQMQKATDELEMQREMHGIEKQKLDILLKQKKREEDLDNSPISGILKVFGITPPEGSENTTVGQAKQGAPIADIFRKQEKKPLAIGGKGVYEEGEFKEAPWADKEEPKAPTVRTFTEGDKTVDRQWNPQTQKWEEIGSGPRYKPPGPEKGPTTFQLNKTATDYRKEFNNLPEIKEHNSIQPKLKSMEAAFNESKKTKNYIAVDQAMITLFNKLSDPSSVVRESEYARMALNLPFVNALKGKVAKVLKGGAGLTDDDRNNIMAMANLMKQAYSEVYNARADEYRGYGTIVGANPDLIAKPSKAQSTGVWTQDKNGVWVQK